MAGEADAQWMETRRMGLRAWTGGDGLRKGGRVGRARDVVQVGALYLPHLLLAPEDRRPQCLRLSHAKQIIELMVAFSNDAENKAHDYIALCAWRAQGRGGK